MSKSDWLLEVAEDVRQKNADGFLLATDLDYFVRLWESRARLKRHLGNQESAAAYEKCADDLRKHLTRVYNDANE